jgi:hypothetical protein
VPIVPDPSATVSLEALASALSLPLDRTRLLTAPVDDPAACSAALAALANSRGGYLVLISEGPERAQAHDAGGLAAWLSNLAAGADPPLTGLVDLRIVRLDGAEVAVIHVRRSARTPHIDTLSGCVFVVGASGAPEPVRRRSALDQLYRHGSSAQDRAQRAIDGMIERLQLATFGHFGLAIVAALLEPSAVPYEAWRDRPDGIAAASDPFVREWKLAEVAPVVRPSWIEVRHEREVTGVLRVTRGGCSVAAESRQQPPDKALGTPEDVARRVQILVDSACRLLAPAENTEMLSSLLCEGLRGTRLRIDSQPGSFSAVAGEDSLNVGAPSGDAADERYRRELAEIYAQALARTYQLDLAGNAPAG